MNDRMQKTVELIIRHYVAKNGNVRDLTAEQLKEIETAAQVDRWEIEGRQTKEENMHGTRSPIGGVLVARKSR